MKKTLNASAVAALALFTHSYSYASALVCEIERMSCGMESQDSGVSFHSSSFEKNSASVLVNFQDGKGAYPVNFSIQALDCDLKNITIHSKFTDAKDRYALTFFTDSEWSNHNERIRYRPGSVLKYRGVVLANSYIMGSDGQFKSNQTGRDALLLTCDIDYTIKENIPSSASSNDPTARLEPNSLPFMDPHFKLKELVCHSNDFKAGKEAVVSLGATKKHLILDYLPTLNPQTPAPSYRIYHFNAHDMGSRWPQMTVNSVFKNSSTPNDSLTYNLTVYSDGYNGQRTVKRIGSSTQGGVVNLVNYRGPFKIARENLGRNNAAYQDATCTLTYEDYHSDEAQPKPKPVRPRP